MWLGKRWTALTFWCIALVLAVVGGIIGAKWGGSEAPTFDNKDKGAVPANSASHFLYSIFGGVLLALAVIAVFAAIWLIVWARARRAAGSTDESEVPEEDRMSMADVEGLMHTEDEEPGQPTSWTEDARGVFDQDQDRDQV